MPKVNFVNIFNRTSGKAANLKSMYEALEFLEKPKPKPKPKPKLPPKIKEVSRDETIQEKKGTPTSDAEAKADEAIRRATEDALKMFDTSVSKQSATPKPVRKSYH